MFGLVKQKELDQVIREYSSFEYGVVAAENTIQEYKQGYISASQADLELMHLCSHILKNKVIDDRKAIELTHLITEIGLLICELEKLKEDTTE